MYKHCTSIRVRYSETDKMSFVYYGNYAQYFEVARVEALRNLGFRYKNMGDNGILLPVYDYQIKFLKPAMYDDLITIHCSIPKLPQSRIVFEYLTYNEKNELLNQATTTLVFVSAATYKPIQAPVELIQQLMKFYE